MRGFTVYFLHNRITPNNVRMVWTDAPGVPATGDKVRMIDPETQTVNAWTVVDRLWLNATAVELTMRSE